jgi:large subunit ribosomal protein L9
MQVLLLKDVPDLGRAGEVKRVSDGYARNFLLARGLAVIATPGTVKQSEHHRQAIVNRQTKELSEAQALAQALDGLTISFQAHAGETDRLYGSITNVMIAEALSAKIGREVDRRKIDLEEPLKELGTHTVTIRLGLKAEAKVIVVVEREE